MSEGMAYIIGVLWWKCSKEGVVREKYIFDKVDIIKGGLSVG